MKDFIIKNYNTIQYFFMCGLVLFPFLPRGIESVLLILMFIISIIFYIYEGRYYWNKKKSKHLFLNANIFFIFIFSAIYSQNYNVSIKYFLQILPLLTLPLIFLSVKGILIDSSKKRVLLKLYVFALFGLLIYINLYYFKSLYVDNIGTYQLRILIENLVDVHGTYLSMWIGFGILILINQIAHSIKHKTNLYIYVMLLFYFVYWILEVNARMPLIATFIVSYIYILVKLKISLKKTIISFFSLFFIFLFFFKDPILIKIKRLTDFESAIPVGKYENNWPYISNDDIRSGIYHCSFETILKNPLLGVGIGDVDELLQQCYDSVFYYTDIFKIQKYNSHSQYLLIILSTGFIGFLIYIISYIFLFKIAIKGGFSFYFCFLIFASICFFSENILSRHDGVIFFGLFNSLLFFIEKEF